MSQFRNNKIFIYESCEWMDNLVNYLLQQPVKTSFKSFKNSFHGKYYFKKNILSDEKSVPEYFKNQLSMILTKTFIWLQIFWSLTPTIRELDSREGGITKKKYLVII